MLDETLGQLIVAELEEINALLDKLRGRVRADVLVLWSNRVHIYCLRSYGSCRQLLATLRRHYTYGFYWKHKKISGKST